MLCFQLDCLAVAARIVKQTLVLLGIEVSANKTSYQHDAKRATRCENECRYDSYEGAGAC